jgi:DNA-binding GntR family transcriptional regulator
VTVAHAGGSVLAQADTRGAAEGQRVIDAHDAVVTRIVKGDAVGAAAAMSCHFALALVYVQRQAA